MWRVSKDRIYTKGPEGFSIHFILHISSPSLQAFISSPLKPSADEKHLKQEE